MGSYSGFIYGRLIEREKIIIDLTIERYDAHQNAKFASDSERQDEILKDAEAINRTFRIFKEKRYFDGLPNRVYESAFPNKDKE